MISVFDISILAGFTSPIHVGTDPLSFLWLFPLTLAISIVYKATKVYEIKFVRFAKEVLGLFLSIIAFLLMTAVVLYVVQWIFT